MFSGVLLESSSSGDGHAVPGSPEAVQRLFAAGLPVRFLTNESQCTRRLLWEKLNRLGYSLPGDTDKIIFVYRVLLQSLRTGIAGVRSRSAFEWKAGSGSALKSGLRMRIPRIRMFLVILAPHPDPFVTSTDPDPSLFSHRCWADWNNGFKIKFLIQKFSC